MELGSVNRRINKQHIKNDNLLECTNSSHFWYVSNPVCTCAVRRSCWFASFIGTLDNSTVALIISCNLIFAWLHEKKIIFFFLHQTKYPNPNCPNQKKIENGQFWKIDMNYPRRKIFSCHVREIYYFSKFKISEKMMKWLSISRYPEFSIPSQLSKIDIFLQCMNSVLIGFQHEAFIQLSSNSF